MLEDPKPRWERLAPLILAAVVLLAAGGAAFTYFAPELSQRAPQAHLDTSVADIAEIGSQHTARPDTAQQNVWIEWEAGQETNTYRVGGFEFSLRAVVTDGFNAARMRISTDEGMATEITGQGLSWRAQGRFAVIQLDENQSSRQVLFSSYSGGAHCCVSLTLLEVSDDDWRRIELGTWDGDVPRLPRDLDGDGVKEFTFVDQRFLYAFDSYAGSWAPTVIIAANDGRMRDVSSERRFRAVYRRDLADMRDACVERQNGACAAYVATAARVGELDEAWALMLRSYDQTSSWSYPSACRVRTSGQCPPEAELQFASFPESLQWFLGEHGYTAPSYVEPLNARGPSFSCGGARNATEQMVCASSELTVLDRTLARAYTRAFALTEDRAALRRSQRAFLAIRDQESDELTIASLYIERIRQLSAV